MTQPQQTLKGVLDLTAMPADWTMDAKAAQSIVEPITARYRPQADITAWELAQIMPFLLGKPCYEPNWAELGDATRHMERVVPTP